MDVVPEFYVVDGALIKRCLPQICVFCFVGVLSSRGLAQAEGEWPRISVVGVRLRYDKCTSIQRDGRKDSRNERKKRARNKMTQLQGRQLAARETTAEKD